MFVFLLLCAGVLSGFVFGTWKGYNWQLDGKETVKEYYNHRASLLAMAEDEFKIACDGFERESEQRVMQLVKQYASSIISPSTLKVVQAASAFVLSTDLGDRSKLELALAKAVKAHRVQGAPNLNAFEVVEKRSMN